MKRILLAHPVLAPRGGGQAVAAWTVQALHGVCDLTLLSIEPTDWPAVNRMFGTQIDARRIRAEFIPSWQSRVVRRMPIPLSLLQIALIQRRAQELTRERGFDVVISTNNEADLGQRGIQYVHYPWADTDRPAGDWRAYQQIPGAIGLYRNFCARVGGTSWDRLRNNLSLVNSQFTAGLVAKVYGVEARVLHPPVPIGPPVEWGRRNNTFVCLGRIHPEKRIGEVVDILDAVRRRGHDIRLSIVGTADSGEYLTMLNRKVSGRDWIDIHLDLPQEEMTRLVAESRFGIHAMIDEHFGIALAAMQGAGCIAFAHRSGGPVEILDGDTRILFVDDADAVDKIDAVLRDPKSHRQLHDESLARGRRYGEDRFVESVRELVLPFET